MNGKEIEEGASLYRTQDAMTIALLVAAGHVSEHQVGQARAIALATDRKRPRGSAAGRGMA
jgi:hypothetical protein